MKALIAISVFRKYASGNNQKTCSILKIAQDFILRLEDSANELMN